MTTLPKLAALRILVLGDILLDHYVFGAVERISPEAPVPVLRVERDEYRLGGAANVAANLAGLGAKVSLAGLIGDDAPGRRLAKLAEKQRIRFLSAPRTSATIVKTRLVAQRQQICRLDREPPPPSQQAMLAPWPALSAALHDADAVLVSDYAKGAVSAALLEQIRADAGGGRGGPFLAMAPKPQPRLDRSGFDLITMNRAEALALIGESSESSAREILAAAQAALAAPNWVVTLGAEGLVYATPNREPTHLPVEKQDVADVSGAGDTVFAVLSAVLAAGGSLAEASKQANQAAARVIRRLGTSALSPEDAKALFA